MMQPTELDELLRKITETRQDSQEVIRSLQGIINRLTRAAQQESTANMCTGRGDVTPELVQDITGRC